MDCDTVFGSHILQLADKLRMGKVVHLLTPKARHAREIEVFKTDGVIPLTQVMRKFPLKIGASVSDCAVDSVKLLASALPVMTSFLRERKPAGRLAEPSEVVTEKSRIVNARAIGESHVGFKTEIHTNGCTFMCLSDGVHGSVENQHDMKISDSVSLNDKPFYNSVIGAAKKELECLADFINCKTVVFYLVATLLEYDRREVLCPFELGRSLGDMVKEPLIGGVKTLNHLLNSLRVEATHLVSLCKMRFKAVGIDEFAEHPIVTLLQCKAMIPYKGSLSQHSRKILVSLGVI